MSRITEDLTVLNIDPTEVREVGHASSLNSFVLPQLKPGVGSADTCLINLGGVQFPALVITHADSDDVDCVLDMNTGIFYQLFPVKRYTEEEIVGSLEAALPAGVS